MYQLIEKFLESSKEIEDNIFPFIANEPTPNPSANPTTETKEVKEDKKEGSGVLTLIIGVHCL